MINSTLAIDTALSDCYHSTSPTNQISITLGLRFMVCVVKIWWLFHEEMFEFGCFIFIGTSSMHFFVLCLFSTIPLFRRGTVLSTTAPTDTLAPNSTMLSESRVLNTNTKCTESYDAAGQIQILSELLHVLDASFERGTQKLRGLHRPLLCRAS